MFEIKTSVRQRYVIKLSEIEYASRYSGSTQDIIDARTWTYRWKAWRHVEFAGYEETCAPGITVVPVTVTRTVTEDNNE